ncbi:MAG: LytTR family transcriptional regulator [Lachnospiraceae bacterium]|nr:LytTR family transcriptional regulator [Lachnospiraceae bacterium]
MKIRLAISDEKYEEVKSYFQTKGIDIDDEAEFILTEKEKYAGHISARKNDTGDKAFIATDEVLYIESYGHQLEIVTSEELFISKDPLYQLEKILDPKLFTRISKSVIISKRKVKEIRPSLSMKFVLVMADNRKLEVTRNYYSSFKKAFNI